MADVNQTGALIVNLLKTVYGAYLPNQINTEAGVLPGKLNRTRENIVGGVKVVKAAPWGLNGGAGFISDGGSLPATSQQTVLNFESTIKNIAARSLFTKKAMLLSQSDKGAFKSIAKQSMESLKESALFLYALGVYGDTTGAIATCGTTSDSATVVVASTQNLVEGMVVDIVAAADGTAVTNGTQRKIKNVASATTFVLEGTAKVTTSSDHVIVPQGSYGLGLTGVEAVMAQSGSIYGNDRSTYAKLKAAYTASTGEIDDTKIVNAIIDREMAGSKIDLLIAHPLVWSKYGDFLTSTKQAVNTNVLDGGWTALKVGGKDLTYDRFAKAQTLRGFDTTKWKEHVLEDWTIDGNMDRVPGTLNFEIILSKFAEVICDMPGSSFSLEGITV